MTDAPKHRLIKALSMQLLEQAQALDVFPTPIDRLVDTADEFVSTQIDSSANDTSFFSRLLMRLRSAGRSRIDALADDSFTPATLTLDDLPTEYGYQQLRQVGYQLLAQYRPKRAGLIHAILLDTAAWQAVEEEVDYFAANTLFQQDRFDRELAKRVLDLKTIIDLSKKFGGPLHITAWHVVNRSTRRCALVVMEQTDELTFPFALAVCQCTALHVSQRFASDFGGLAVPEELNKDWCFARDYLNGYSYRENGSIVLNTANGFARFTYHFVTDDDRGLAFILPEGEERLSGY